MADVIDVQNALVAIIAQTLYPNGTGQPSAAGGVPIKAYAGWPSANQLDADLRTGTVNVSIYPTQIERNTTRYPKEWQDMGSNAATLTLTPNGQQITVGGAMPSPLFYAQNAMAEVNGQPYVYATQSGDTLTSIATALATLIPSGTNVGPVITAPGKISAARIGTTGTLARELRRQERVFMVSIWAETPAHRELVAQLIDGAMAAIQFLTMPDQFAARVIYKSSYLSDAQQKAKLYRRDLNYSVEYATTQTTTATQVTQITESIGMQPNTVAAPLATVTVNQ